MPVLPHMRVGSYVIQSLLGAGGMGEVYRARDTQLERDVAIKVLPSFLSHDPERLRRFEQEARAAAALNHPNILAVYQMGDFEGSPYLVSELLEGATLRELLQGGPLSSRKAIDYGAQIAHGLAAAHEKGIVHRDLKPENLFVTKDGRVKILDFGLAKLIERPRTDETVLTVTNGTAPGIVMGTVGYMSPEQVRGKPADHRTDVFAFGAVLYELLSGRRAFEKPTGAETMAAILNEEPSGLGQPSAGLPPGLERLVHRCLEKAPEQRFQSASDLAFALEAISDSGSSSNSSAAAPMSSGNRWIWMAVAAVVAAVAVGLVGWWRSPAAVPVVESMTQLTDDGQPKSGRLVTDGSRVYFNEGQPGSESIMQVAVTGGHTATVPSRLANPGIEAVSPDGSQLLVGVGGFNQPLVSLWSIPLPAGEPRRMGNLNAAAFSLVTTGSPTFASNASYTPDGRIVAAMDLDLFTADADGSNARKLLSFSNRILRPRFSPNGKQMVFDVVNGSLNGNLGHSLVETDGSGSAFHSLTKSGVDGPSCCPEWTPDGRYVIAEGGTAPRSDIWLIPMQTDRFHRSQPSLRLTNGPLLFDRAAPALDGRHIFAIGKRERGEFLRYDVKSKQFLQFLPGISGQDAQVSRDGQWVVYQSYPDLSLWRCRSDGSDALQLTYPPMRVRTPRISPDGKRISFDSLEGIYLIGMDGGTPESAVASTEGSQARSAHWSPQGDLLEFTMIGVRGKLEILDLSSKKITDVPSSAGFSSAVFVAEDKLVAVPGGSKKLVLLDLKTGKQTDLFSAALVNWVPSRDLKSMFITTGGSNPSAMRVRIADGRAEPVVSLRDLRRAATPMGVAQDDSLIFTRDIGTQEIYSLAIKWP